MIWARVVFPVPGRAGEDDRRQPIRFDRAPEQFARRENVLLPDELLERARPHPAGERRGGVGLRTISVFFLAEEVLHAGD